MIYLHFVFAIILIWYISSSRQLFIAKALKLTKESLFKLEITFKYFSFPFF